MYQDVASELSSESQDNEVLQEFISEKNYSAVMKLKLAN